MLEKLLLLLLLLLLLICRLHSTATLSMSQPAKTVARQDEEDARRVACEINDDDDDRWILPSLSCA